MRGVERNIHLNRELIRLIDELLNSSDWESSLLLRAVSKQFKELREQAVELLDQSVALSDGESGSIRGSGGSSEETQPVFICVYQLEGYNLHKWEENLKALSTNNIGRRVYKEESSAVQAIHERVSERGRDLTQEGYVAVRVDKKDIVNLPKYESNDRFGNALLTLRKNAVRPSNIDKFVHANSRVYRFKKNKLSLVSDVD